MYREYQEKIEKEGKKQDQYAKMWFFRKYLKHILICKWAISKKAWVKR